MCAVRARREKNRISNDSNRPGETIQPHFACVSCNKRISDHQYILKYLLKETKRTRRRNEGSTRQKKREMRARRKKQQK